MIKLVGSLCILTGGVLIRQTLLREYRRRLVALSDLSASLRGMGAEIRVMHRPLPEVMRSMSRSCGPEACSFFSGIAVQAERGEDPVLCWKRMAHTLPLSERDCGILTALGDDLRGDETRVCSALDLAANRLAESRDTLEKERQAETRRTTALSLSAAALLVILLI